MSRAGLKNVLPSTLPTRHTADYSRIEPKPGPWMDGQWVVVAHAGDSRRGSLAECCARDCAQPCYTDKGADGALCYAHYFQWVRAGRPDTPAQWAALHAKPPKARRGAPVTVSRSIPFELLPPLVAMEMRYVVGEKIAGGAWTPNRALLDVMEALVEAVVATGASSLLDRRPEDWVLLIRQRVSPGRMKSMTSYFTTFFATLHRALLADPWAEDKWLWKNGFKQLLGDTTTQGDTNIDWGSIEQPWLRQPVKQLARLALTTGTRSWGTILGWRRALIPLSQYLAVEGIDSPELLDRELFLEYLLSVRDGGASKNALMGVNTAASVLAALKEPNDDGIALLPSLGSPIYLRRGENAVEKTRAPRPYPEDVINSIDTLVLVDEQLDETARKMLRFNRWAGARCSELVTLPLDCLRINGKGGYWVEYLMPKTKNVRRFPLPDDLAELLLEQQRFVRAAYGDQAQYMFPSPARSNRRAGTVEPWSASGFRNAVAASFVRNGITVSATTGERISGGQIHRYRHTVGTSLLNSGWSQHEVAEFLGHVSPTMTAVYAQILDETLNEKSRAFHEQQQIDKPKPTDPQEHPGVERLRSRFTAVLPLGYCQLPAAQQCDFRKNPCLDCSFFDPGGDEFQPVQANHRKQLRLFIADVADDPAKVALNQKALDAMEGLPGSADDEDVPA